jgi:hypothetical protein
MGLLALLAGNQPPPRGMRPMMADATRVAPRRGEVQQMHTIGAYAPNDRGGLMEKVRGLLGMSNLPQEPGLLGKIAEVVGLNDPASMVDGPVKAISVVGRAGAMARAADNAGAARVLLRAAGEQSAARGDDAMRALTREGHAYRGMTAEEFEATVGSGRGVMSRNDFSLGGEGTSYAADFATAEDYANFGRTDPRKTGRPTYIAEVPAKGLERNRQGYFYGREPRQPTRVWRVVDDGGALKAELIPLLRPK